MRLDYETVSLRAWKWVAKWEDYPVPAEHPGDRIYLTEDAAREAMEAVKDGFKNWLAEEPTWTVYEVEVTFVVEEVKEVY